MGQEVTSAVTLNDVIVSQLAREIARDIVPFDAVLKKFRLDTATYERIFDLPFFQRRLEEELAVWNGSDSGSIRTRIAAKAATVIEESLMEVFDLVHDKSQPLSGKVEALKFAARLASMGDGAAPSDGDNRVIINIRFGSESITFEKQRAEMPVLDVTPLDDEQSP
jgi:hypothetical protein